VDSVAPLRLGRSVVGGGGDAPRGSVRKESVGCSRPVSAAASPAMTLSRKARLPCGNILREGFCRRTRLRRARSFASLAGHAGCFAYQPGSELLGLLFALWVPAAALGAFNNDLFLIGEDVPEDPRCPTKPGTQQGVGW
jgi:hypothetical protein